MRFEECDYKTRNFILNIGSVFWFVVIWVLLVLFVKLLKLIKNKTIEKLTQKLEDFIFYTLLVRIVLESYLEIMISAFLNSSHVSFHLNLKLFWSTNGEIVASLLCISTSVSLHNFRLLLGFSRFIFATFF